MRVFHNLLWATAFLVTAVSVSSQVPVYGPFNLPTGSVAVTQPSYDNSTLIATDAFVMTEGTRFRATVPITGLTGGTYNLQSAGSGAVISWTASGGTITNINGIFGGGSGYKVGDIIAPLGGNRDAILVVTTVSGTAATGMAILYGGSGFVTAVNVAVGFPSVHSAVIELSGTLTSDATILVDKGTPLLNSHQFIVTNNTTGPYAVRWMMSDGAGSGIGTGVYIPQGTANSIPAFLMSDGLTDVWLVTPDVSGSLTFTTATSDTLALVGTTSTSHCTFSPANATAAAATVVGYVSAVGLNSVTISHVATTANGGIVNIICTAH